MAIRFDGSSSIGLSVYTPQTAEQMVQAKGEGEAQGPGKKVRFLFAGDNPDLVMYMFSLRTEPHMRMVMPTVVRHSFDCLFMAMARFETASNGNSHWHGFGMGLSGSCFEGVRAGVEGGGVEAPDTTGDDGVILQHSMMVVAGNEVCEPLVPVISDQTLRGFITYLCCVSLRQTSKVLCSSLFALRRPTMLLSCSGF